MSLDGSTYTFVPYTINGINTVASPSDVANCVKYNGNTSNTDLNGYNLTTSGTLSAQTLAIPANPTNDESWITYTVSTMGNLSTAGGLITTDLTNGRSMYFTGGVLGAPNFQFATLGTNADKVICTDANGVFSTTINAGQLSYITGLTSQAGGVGQNNTWTGTNNFDTLTSVASLKITSSIANTDFALSVNGTNQLEFTNLLTNQAIYTDGGSLWLPGNNYCSGTVYCVDNQISGFQYFAYGSPNQWSATVNGSGNYEIADDGGVMRLQVSKTTGLTVSTMTISQVPSATPTLALGVNGSGGVVSFAVPTTTGFVPYTGATSNVNLGSYNIIANTAQFTNIVSATPSLALGIDASGNLNKFAVPTYTDLLPLSNVWLGATNTFNFDVNVGGALGVNGNIVKRTASALIYTAISGGTATNSPYVDFVAGGSSRGYIGNANSTDMFVVAQNGAQMNFDVAGSRRLSLTTSGGASFQSNVFAEIGYYFRKVGGNSGANFVQLSGEDLNNCPYLGFYVSGTRKCYIGFANSTDMYITCENNTNLNFSTQGAARLRVMTGGETVIPALGTWGQIRLIEGSYGWFIRNDGSNTYILLTNAGDQYGQWNGLRPLYMSNSQGFVVMESGVKITDGSFKQGSIYGKPFVYGLNGFVVQSQALQRSIYASNGVGWSNGGVNITYAFYKYDAYTPVRLSGKISGYAPGGGMSQYAIRIYSQQSGTYRYYYYNKYFNEAYTHEMHPLEAVFQQTDLPETGWFDVYLYNTSLWITDGNDQLFITATVLPAGGH